MAGLNLVTRASMFSSQDPSEVTIAVFSARIINKLAIRKSRVGAVTLAMLSASVAPGTAVAATINHQPTTTWQLAFQDNFSGSTLNTKAWSVYNGPGNGSNGPRSRTNVSVGNGILNLRTTLINGRWYGSGVSAARVTTQTYGKYLMRIRFDKGYGVRATALLWPTSSWPPEVDFYEVSATDANRQTNMLTNHFGANNRMQHAFVHGYNLSTWHVVGLEWTPNALVYTMDGKVVDTMTGHVPHQQMWLGIQTALGKPPYLPNSGTPRQVNLQIDWVQVYRLS